MNRIYIVILIAALIICQHYFINAQTDQPRSPLVINVDMSRFRQSQDSSYLEVYYAVYPGNVTLVPVHDSLVGTVLLRTKIRDIQKDSLLIDVSSQIPVKIRDTMLYQSKCVGKMVFLLPAGTYNISIQGSDTKNPGRRDSTIRNISINKYNDALNVSDIDLCSKIIESSDRKNLFYKNSFIVVPNPSLLFGGKEAAIVFSYSELYNINPNSSYSITIGLIDEKGNFIKKKNNVRRYSSRNTVDVNFLNIYAVPSGKYKYVLLISDTLGRESSRSGKPIYIYNPHLQSVEKTSDSMTDLDLIGLTDDELIKEFRCAKYIASSEDISLFDKMNSWADRKEFLTKFWKDIEKREQSTSSLNRRIYLERVKTADQRYHSMGRDGWHTDRGRIYILYGEPDDIERFPNSENAKPYEIWYYNNIENGVKFIFVDSSVIGDYSLVHSTKRGEIQDENWEQKLQ